MTYEIRYDETTAHRFLQVMTKNNFPNDSVLFEEPNRIARLRIAVYPTSKTPYVAIDERGMV